MLPRARAPSNVGLTNHQIMCPAIYPACLPGTPIGYELEAGAGLLLEEDAAHAPDCLDQCALAKPCRGLPMEPRGQFLQIIRRHGLLCKN